MYIEVDRIVDAAQRTALAEGIERVLADVRASVTDWQAMLTRLIDATHELGRTPTNVPAADVAESCAFLEWLADDHFTLLGYRCHDLVDDEAGFVTGSTLSINGGQHMY